MGLAGLGDGDYLRIEVWHGVNGARNGDTVWAATSEGLLHPATRRLPWRLHKQSQLPDVSLTSIARDSPATCAWVPDRTVCTVCTPATWTVSAYTTA
ncbi:MAG: hypothetical protein IPL52_18045 [Flavobacteriales bacterium]|nr:hypothetical protein [Flavobacteriales bacterium]